ncbi:MAG: hypothetical protein WD942_05230, partial [Dehalococcoidia bacterium]
VRKPVGVSMAKDVSRASTVWRATQTLLSADPEVVLYACASGSFIRGIAGEESIRQTMLQAGAKRAVTTSSAMIEAFRTAGVRRVALATPYTERLTRALGSFVEDTGIEVVSTSFLGIDRELTNVSRETIRDLVMDAYHPDADAVFVSCTALRTFGIVAQLESEMGIPVFTSNQVSLWAALCAAQAMYRDDERLLNPDELLGGASPMAQSTSILLSHARQEQAWMAEAAMQLPQIHPDEIIVS